MRILKILLAALVGLVLAAAVGIALLLTYEGDPPVDPAWAVRATSPIPPDAVTVRFTGTTTLVFDDGETRWITDGWFTRHPFLTVLLDEVEPDLEAIGKGLAANEVEELAAVIPLHSHYDHAMDAPEVARRTGAILMGSQTTAFIGRGWGLPEDRIQVFEDRRPVRVGAFTITPIESRHYVFGNPLVRGIAGRVPPLDRPLVPPVPSSSYPLGKAYVLHVSHPKGDFVVVGSAGYQLGGLAGFEADAIFLGIGGIGGQTEEYREEFWRETVGMVKPTRIFPIHWDNTTTPLEGPFRGYGALLTFLSGGGAGETLSFLKAKEAEDPGLSFGTLPRYDEVVLFR